MTADHLSRAGRARRRAKPNVEVRQATERTVTVRGNGAKNAIRRAGCPSHFDYRPADGGLPCWVVPARCMRDVMAAAESLGGHAKAVLL